MKAGAAGAGGGRAVAALRGGAGARHHDGRRNEPWAAQTGRPPRRGGAAARCGARASRSLTFAIRVSGSKGLARKPSQPGPRGALLVERLEGARQQQDRDVRDSAAFFLMSSQTS